MKYLLFLLFFIPVVVFSQDPKKHYGKHKHLPLRDPQNLNTVFDVDSIYGIYYIIYRGDTLQKGYDSLTFDSGIMRYKKVFYNGYLIEETAWQKMNTDSMLLNRNMHRDDRRKLKIN